MTTGSTPSYVHTVSPLPPELSFVPSFQLFYFLIPSFTLIPLYPSYFLCLGARGGPVDSASERNEHQKYFLGGKVGRSVGLTTLPPSCADCLEIWNSWNSRGLYRPVMGLHYLYFLSIYSSTYNCITFTFFPYTALRIIALSLLSFHIQLYV
jgi:hypothetical protein